MTLKGEEMIEWSKGFVSNYYAMVVDPVTWRDVSRIELVDGSINYTDSGLRGSADITCGEFDYENEQWIRIYLNARQGYESENIPLFTGLSISPDLSYNGKTLSNKIQCFSPLTIADVIYLPLGWYARKDANGAETIKDLLSEIVPAPIIIDGSSPNLSQNLVAEKDETYLKMIDKILESIGWVIKLDGNGTIRISPESSDIVGSFDHINNRFLEEEIEIHTNWDKIPNVFRAIGNGVSAIAKDENGESRFSIQNRGREIWEQDTSVTLNDGETIGEYADRRLQELQELSRTASYSRRYEPNVRIGDRISINYPNQNLVGIFTVTSQTINLSYSCRVSEEIKG